MADLTTLDKQLLEKTFQMASGYVLNFSDRTMEEFFRDDLGIIIYSEKYDYQSGSKANRMRAFWLREDNKTVGNGIIKLIEYIETQIILDNLSIDDFPKERLGKAKLIGERLLGKSNDPKEVIKSNAKLRNGNITITLQKDVFEHVEKLLNDGHYFNAVEESYKIVRKKLQQVSGEERATDAFKSENYEKVFRHKPRNDAEKDFFEGIKFLHMAIQFLRNEKAHTPAYELDKNLAIHYIVLASLAYDLISWEGVWFTDEY